MSQNDQSKVPGGADLIIPVAAGAYAIYYVYSVWDFPFEAQISGLALAGLVCALVLAYFARTALDVLRGRQSLGFGSVSDSRKLRSAGLVFLLTVGYIVAVPPPGFTLTTFAFLAASFIILGARPIRRAVTVEIGRASCRERVVQYV